MKYSIALDIGATKILGGVVQNNKVIKTLKKPTNSKSDKQNIIKNIINIVSELKKTQNQKNKLINIGIGIAGQVNNKNGIVLSTTNFNKDFKNIKLAEILNKEFKVPVKIENDVKCFVKAEANLGAGKNLKNIIGLTFGTGIGGGIFMDNKIWQGKDNTAGEFGHMKISGKWIGEIPVCNCGQKYCWETVASGKAWQKIYKKTNRKKANEIIVHNIVIGLINLSFILNPDVFILGGGLMEHKDILILIKKEFNLRAPWSNLKKVKIVNAKLGENAILLGSLL